MQKLIKFIENLNPPLYRPSHLQELRHISEYFEVPDLDTKVQRLMISLIIGYNEIFYN